MSNISSLFHTIRGYLDQIEEISKNIQDQNLTIEINDAKSFLNEQITSPGLEAIAMPFFTAFARDPNNSASTTIDFISSIFHFAEPQLHPTEKLLRSSLDVITEIAKVNSEDTKLKACKSLTAIIQSLSGSLFLHGDNLYNYYNAILTLFDSVERNSRSSEVIEMTLHETMRIVIGCYDTIAFRPHFITVEELSQFSINQISLYSLFSLSIIPHSQHLATIHDVDMTVAIKYLSILENKFSKNTKILILKTLYGILRSRSPFFTKPFFPDVLKLYVLPIILHFVKEYEFDDIDVVSDLILTTWSIYTPIFEESLFKIFNDGIIPMLKSKNNEEISHACAIVQHIATNSCAVFVDLFSRFDLNSKYSNVFGKTLSTLISIIDSESSTYGISALAAVVEGLFNFYIGPRFHSQNDIKENEEEGLSIFKNNPQQGLEYYIQNKFVKDDKKEIGNFIFNRNDLDKQSVTTILESDAYSECLDEFLENNFKLEKFSDILLNILKRLIIPDDLTHIDNILTHFTQKFYRSHPSVYETAEDVYNMIFASIICYANTHYSDHTDFSFEEFLRICGKNTQNLGEIFETIKNTNIELTFSHQEKYFTRDQTQYLFQQNAKSSSTCQDKETVDKMLKDSDLLDIYSTAANIFQKENDYQKYINSLRCLAAAFKLSAQLYRNEVCEIIFEAMAKFSNQLKSTEKGRDCSSFFTKMISEIPLSLQFLWPKVIRQIADEFIFNGAEDVYASTQFIDNDSLIDFVKSQSTLACEQLKEEKASVTRMVRRMADVLCYNVNRPRYIWTKVWNEVSSFYISSQCCDICYLVSSIIQQIFLTYIKGHRIEQADFNDQEKILNQLLSLFRLNREDSKFSRRVVEDIGFVIKESKGKMRSGWSPIFSLLLESCNEFKKEVVVVLEDLVSEFDRNSNKYCVQYAGCLSSVCLVAELQDVLHLVPFFSVVISLCPEENPIAWKSIFNLLLALCKRSDDVCEIAAELAIENALKYSLAHSNKNDEVWRYLLEVGFSTAVNSAKKKELKRKLAGEVVSLLFGEKGDISQEEISLFLESIYGEITIAECIEEAKKRGAKEEIIEILNKVRNCK
ncbi:hypothetical protein TVAG_374040 [Trichomonas vaginalis G3]|uniref:SEC7 domain-containing protein n=1 Tax=Trichomonas vaginalis (strain ATCC PRA-98 / G3) TaxID=412133 RepID=A2EBT5_TRIV3|nr:regulation of ARF protein signal transduction [Trichomonas vaginalis G3]EAY09897.1 hypothetical protein TVAG_374040 [Trichomonas vaginalis G3]KAI5514663.1 regulation of ARF protein signal transduction [Trichomonas vaginalis G3]|eukprot:XP_001322120.1 hypothetical protein [Trichomonas vaginalis G3]